MSSGLILITGASGFVGNVLCQHLLNANYSIRASSRRAFTHDSRLGLKIYSGLESPDAGDYKELLSGVQTVIHLAARVHIMKDSSKDPLAEFRKVNVDGTLKLARHAASAGVKRFIFLSSVKVNGEQTEEGKSFTEDCNPSPQDAYGQSKYEAEQGLLKIAQETGMEVVIIRPPLVYGAGVKANFASMMETVRRGIPLPLGSIHNQRSFVYLGNLISLIECCIHHTAAVNQVFLVSDGHDLSTTELLRNCAAALGVKSWLLPMPQWLIEGCARLLGKQAVAQRLCGNLQVDISKARRMLGWTPPFSVADGLKQTAASFKGLETLQ